MTSFTNRARYFFYAWYQPKYKMDRDDWLFIAYMTAGANLSFGIGFLIGYVLFLR